MFSKTCENAIRATIYIASESSEGKRCGIRDIARKIESPEPFTAKILQRLVKADIIKSIKGNGGGFEIEKAQWEAVKLEDKDALEMMEKNGMKITEASDDLKKQLDVIANKMLEDYLADADAQTKEIFKKYRK